MGYPSVFNPLHYDHLQPERCFRLVKEKLDQNLVKKMLQENLFVLCIPTLGSKSTMKITTYT